MMSARVEIFGFGGRIADHMRGSFLKMGSRSFDSKGVQCARIWIHNEEASTFSAEYVRLSRLVLRESI